MDLLLLSDEVGEDPEEIDPEINERNEIYKLIVLNYNNIFHVCGDQLEDE